MQPQKPYKSEIFKEKKFIKKKRFLFQFAFLGK